MARTFSTTPEIATLEGEAYSVSRQDGGYSLRSRDAGGQVRQSSIDATIGSGRHLRMLLSRTANGWMELPLAWYSENGGHYAAGPGFGFSSACLGCHARQKDDHVAAFGCASCHGSAGSGKPTEAVCLECHPAAGGADAAHSGAGPAKLAASADGEKFELNSAGYRLLASRCYQAAGGRLTCMTCHPAHSFSKTAAEYRMVCRGCHASTHEAQPLDCVRATCPSARHRIRRA